MTVKLDKLVGREFTCVANDTVSARAFREVRDLICGRYGRDYGDVEPYMNDIGMNWEQGPKDFPISGAWPKRLANHLYKHGIKLKDSDKAEIGEIAKRGLTNGAYYGRIVNSIDWKPGDFGDRGSCYWGGRNSARYTIANNGGGAVVWYRDEKRTIGVSRALILPKARLGLVLFNAYGSLSLEAIADAVAQELGTFPARRIRLTEDGRDDGLIWINGGRGMLVPMSKTEPRTVAINFRLDRPHNCESCGDTTNSRWHGRWLCEACTPIEHHCKHCEQTFYEIRAWSPEDVCRTCLTTLYYTCDSCHTLTLKTNKTLIKVNKRAVSLCAGCSTMFYSWKETQQPRKFHSDKAARRWFLTQPNFVQNILYYGITFSDGYMGFLNKWLMENTEGEVIDDDSITKPKFNVGDRIVYIGTESASFGNQVGTLVGWKDLDNDGETQPYLTQWDSGGWSMRSNGTGTRYLVAGRVPPENTHHGYWWTDDDEIRLATESEITDYDRAARAILRVGSRVRHIEHPEWGIGTIIVFQADALVQWPAGGWTGRGRHELDMYHLDPNGRYWWTNRSALRVVLEEGEPNG